jgi:isopenicillin-N epimerase
MLRIKYGKELKDEMFNLDKSIKFTNHGSYGSVPKSILEKKFQLQIELEKSPDKWFRFTSYDMYKKNIESLARYLRVNEENLVFTENATDGINCALKSIEFDGCADAILATNYTYPAILNTIDYISKYRFKQEFDQVNVVKAQMRYPIKSVESLLNEFDEKCREIVVEKKQRLRLAVIDHISSATAMLFPIEEIIKLIRKWNKDCIVLIDGAHAIGLKTIKSRFNHKFKYIFEHFFLGHVNLDLTKLDCEFYVSNLHKWFLAPRGCSFLYFKNLSDLSANLSDKICVLQPNYISHGYAKSVQFNFYSRGTKDATSWFLVNECIQFYENYLGGLNK